MHNEFDGIDACVRYESKEPAKRAPRAMTTETRIVVRNVPALGFEMAKHTARGFAKVPQRLHAYASKEVDGTYTVEFR